MTSTGSIGVVYADSKRNIEHEKDKMIFIYSDLSERKHEFRKDLCAEEYQAIRDKNLNPIAEAFHKRVKSSRKDFLDLKSENTLDGAMYLAANAKKYGLANQVGSFKDAVNLAIKLSNQRVRRQTVKALY